MADAHDRIQKHRQARKEGLIREDDPIPPVAKALAEKRECSASTSSPSPILPTR